MKLFVFIQHEEDKINPVSLEALKGAQEIAEKSDGSVSAITFSSTTGEKLKGYDLIEILIIEDMDLSNIGQNVRIGTVIVSPLRFKNSDGAPTTIFAQIIT